MKFSELNSSGQLGWAVMLAICVFSIISTMGGQVTVELSGHPTVYDPFHTGEFFASAANLLFGGDEAYRAIQIHGVSDILPAFLTHEIWGADHHFMPTIIIYRLLNYLAVVLLIIAIIQFNVNNYRKFIILMAVSLIGPSIVGYRDFVLLASINIFLLLQRPTLSSVSNILLQILFGASVAFGLFWSFDRGLAGAIALGLATLIALRADKRFIVSLAIFMLVVVSLDNYNKLFSIDKYLNNLAILISTSSEWSYGLKLWPIVLTIFVIFVNIGALIIHVISTRNKKNNKYVMENTVFLCMLSIFMLKIATNRADLAHIHMGYWVPLILLASTFQSSASASISRHLRIVTLAILGLSFFFVFLIPVFGKPPYVSAIIVGCLILAFSELIKAPRQHFLTHAMMALLFLSFSYMFFSATHKILAGKYSWVASISSPPENRRLATEGIDWAAQMLLEKKATCVFDLSNNGIINALSELPSCTKFIYPVYAGPEHESIIIKELRNNNPAAIVYSADHPSYRIDGRPMNIRFHNLNEYLLNAYRFEECKFGYCIRY